jgi:hypothetical protein
MYRLYLSVIVAMTADCEQLLVTALVGIAHCVRFIKLKYLTGAACRDYCQANKLLVTIFIIWVSGSNRWIILLGRRLSSEEPLVKKIKL